MSSEKKEKKHWCCSCTEEIRTPIVKCDKCGNIMCEGVSSGSCWHNHLIEHHGIDWTLECCMSEEDIENLKTIKEELK